MAEHPITTAVAMRDRATGRFLAAGAWWTDDEHLAVVVDAEEAQAVVRRFACEPGAIELVASGDVRRAVA